MPEVRLCELYLMTIEEASVYFRIGQVTLRNLINANPDEDFYLDIGNRKHLIKRVKMEKWLDNHRSI